MSWLADTAVGQLALLAGLCIAAACCDRPCRQHMPMRTSTFSFGFGQPGERPLHNYKMLTDPCQHFIGGAGQQKDAAPPSRSAWQGRTGALTLNVPASLPSVLLTHAQSLQLPLVLVENFADHVQSTNLLSHEQSQPNYASHPQCSPIPSTGSSCTALAG